MSKVSTANYLNKWKRKTHELRANLVRDHIKRGAVFELAGTMAGGSVQMSEANPNLTYYPVDCDEAVVKQLPEVLKGRTNIVPPATAQTLEDALLQYDGKIGFLDADFRGFPNALTLGIASHLKPEHILEEGTELWINMSRQRAHVSRTGVSMATLPEVNKALEGLQGDTIQATGLSSQIVLAREYLHPDLVVEFSPGITYRGRSDNTTGEEATTPMIAICGRVFKRSPEHPQSTFHTGIRRIPEEYSTEPYEHTEVTPEDLHQYRRLSGGFTATQLLAFAPLIHDKKWNVAQMSQSLGFTVNSEKYGEKLAKLLPVFRPDLDWSALSTDKPASHDEVPAERYWLDAGIDDMAIRTHFDLSALKLRQAKEETQNPEKVLGEITARMRVLEQSLAYIKKYAILAPVEERDRLEKAHGFTDSATAMRLGNRLSAGLEI